MAYDFPASPTDGQTYLPAGGPEYFWNASTGAWLIKTSGSSSAFVAKSGDTMSGQLNVNSNIVVNGGDVYSARSANTGYLMLGTDGQHSLGYDGTKYTFSNSVSGAVNIAATTVSSGSTSGALTVGGGVGVQGALNVAGTVNAMNGLGINTTATSIYNIHNSKSIGGGVNSFGMLTDGIIQSDATSSARIYVSGPSAVAAAFNMTELYHFLASPGSLGGATVTSQYGFAASASLTGATNNMGFYGVIAAATGRWNVYMSGTARNYMKGQLSIGGLTDPGTDGLYVAGPVNFADTTPSTSAGNGALVIAGGVGIQGQITTNGKIQANAAGAYFGGSITTAPTTTSGQLYFGLEGGNRNLVYDGTKYQFSNAPLHINVTTASTSATTGALTVGGGIGVGDKIYVGPGGVSNGIGQLSLDGGSGVGGGGNLAFKRASANSWNVGHITVTSGGSTEDFSFYNWGLSTHALRMAYTTNAITLGSTTASSSPTTGALIVGGGLGVAGATFLGANLTLKPPASATPAVNGEMTFQLTSNTSLVIKVKGSDGTVRAATLTLA